MKNHAVLIQHSADIGRVIREARDARGTTQRTLSLAAGLATPALSNIELAKVDPRLDSVLRLLAVLGLELVVQPRPKDLGPSDVWT